MKVLVTGATGFLGSHIVRQLLQAGHSVRVLRRTTSKLKMLEGLPVETALGDVTDRNSVFEAVRSVEAVFHAAGHVSFWRGCRELQHNINVNGTRHIVEACLAHGVKRLVHTSSIVGIGFATEGRLGDETLAYNWSPYDISYCETKRGGELEVLEGVKRGLDAVIVNPAIIFGPGDLNLNGGAMVFQIARSKFLFYPAGGGCVCDVEDVAEGHLLAFQKGRTGERYILGGDNYSWKELFRLIARTIGVPPPTRRMPTSLFRVLSALADLRSRFTEKEPALSTEAAKITLMPCYFSSDKAIRELGYRISPFRETIRKTYEWYRANRYLRSAPALSDSVSTEKI